MSQDWFVLYLEIPEKDLKKRRTDINKWVWKFNIEGQYGSEVPIFPVTIGNWAKLSLIPLHQNWNIYKTIQIVVSLVVWTLHCLNQDQSLLQRLIKDASKNYWHLNQKFIMIESDFLLWSCWTNHRRKSSSVFIIGPRNRKRVIL